MQLPTFEDVRQADRHIQTYIHRTPILTSQTANELCGGQLFFKCENFQKVGAFKIRGALNALRNLSPSERSRGVITHSSGNHAQALALAAKYFDTEATIVIPENAPKNKINAVREYGANLHFCEPTQESRQATTGKIQEETGSIFIPSYNHPDIIAGQGTVGYELFKEIGDLDQILVPVGGGGLLSGIALAVKHIKPEITLVGVEPAVTNDAYRSYRDGHIIEPESTQTIADGLRTSLGNLTFEIIHEKVDDMVTVSETVISEAMRFMWERLKIVVEPSAAVPFAALMEGALDAAELRTLIIVSGGNADLDHLPWQTNQTLNEHDSNNS